MTDNDLETLRELVAVLEAEQNMCMKSLHNYGRLPAKSRYVADNPVKVLKSRRASVLKKYGMSVDEYADMLEQQRGVCAICECVCASGDSLCVDHCHDTGAVRGLLCTNCNKALGLFKDDANFLRKAVAYLLKARPESPLI